MDYPTSALDTRADPAETTPRRVSVYGDFNCPYSYLANQRVNSLADRGAVQADWRAVEHDPELPVAGIPTEPNEASWTRELGEVTELAMQGERPPSAVPPTMSNTRAAIVAYARATTEQSSRATRARLFDAIWVQHCNISSEEQAQRVVSETTDEAAQPGAAASRAGQWQQEWRSLPSDVVPTLVDTDGTVHRGVAALTRLAELGKD